jgi:hypothetical protein
MFHKDFHKVFHVEREKIFKMFHKDFHNVSQGVPRGTFKNKVFFVKCFTWNMKITFPQFFHNSVIMEF